MNNKALNQQDAKSVDSTKDLKNKLTNYLTIGGIALGTGFVGINTANAANVGGGSTHDTFIATAYVFDIGTKDLIVTTTNADPQVTSVRTGAITDTATGGDLIIRSTANDAVGAIFTLASVTMNQGTTVGANAIIDVDGAVGDTTVNFSGVYTHDGVLTITTLEDTDSETLAVNFIGNATLIAASNLVVSDTITGSINAKFSATTIFTAGIDLKDSTNSVGKSTLTFDSANAQAIGGVVNGQADNMGAIAVVAAGKKTFAAAIGGTNDVKNITVGTSADDSTALFAAAVNAQTITVQGGNAAEEDSLLEFGAAVTGKVVLTAGTLGDATVDFLDDNAIIALTSTITTGSTTGDKTSVRIYDALGGTAAVQTFSAAIGTSTNRIGTLQIGGVSTDGGAADFNADVAVTNLNIAVGAETSELSVGVFGTNVNATTITLTETNAIISSTLTMDTSHVSTLSGTLNGGAANTGTLSVTGAASGAGKTVAGVVGGINPLRMVDLNELTTFSSDVSSLGLDLAAGKLSHVKGNLTIGATNAVLRDATSQLFISGTGNQTITGELTGAGAETGVVDVTNATGIVTFASAMGTTQELKEVELNAGSESIFNSTVKTSILDMAGTAKATFTTKASVVNKLILASTATMIIENHCNYRLVIYNWSHYS